MANTTEQNIVWFNAIANLAAHRSSVEIKVILNVNGNRAADGPLSKILAVYACSAGTSYVSAVSNGCGINSSIKRSSVSTFRTSDNQIISCGNRNITGYFRSNLLRELSKTTMTDTGKIART